MASQNEGDNAHDQDAIIVSNVSKSTKGKKKETKGQVKTAKEGAISTVTRKKETLRVPEEENGNDSETDFETDSDDGDWDDMWAEEVKFDPASHRQQMVHDRLFGDSSLRVEIRPSMAEGGAAEEIVIVERPENPNSVEVRPEYIPLETRVWVCKCGVFNKIMVLECVSPFCSRVRDFVEDPIIDGIPDTREGIMMARNEAELGPDGETLYDVWQCPACTFVNEVEWKPKGMCAQCNSCPEGGILALQTKSYLKPVMPRNDLFANPARDGGGEQDAPNRWGGGSAAAAAGGPAGGRDIFRHNAWRNARRGIVPNLAPLGDSRTPMTFPQFSDKYKVVSRLAAVFGQPYRQKLIALSPRSWVVRKNQIFTHELKMGSLVRGGASHHFDLSINQTRNRLVAVNPQNGWLAVLFSSTTKLLVFRPSNGDYIPFAFLPLNAWITPEDIDESTRVRFVGDHVYLFVRPSYHIHQFAVLHDAVLPRGTLMRLGKLYDPYFQKSRVRDFDVSNSQLSILFGRWVGIYSLVHTEMKESRIDWFHAVGLASQEIRTESMRLIAPEDEVEHAILDSIGEKDVDDDKGTKGPALAPKYRPHVKTNANWVYVCTEAHLVATHLSNPSFEYLNAASVGNSAKNTSFAVSKDFGTFHISPNGLNLIQSPGLTKDTVKNLFQLVKLDGNEEEDGDEQKVPSSAFTGTNLYSRAMPNRNELPLFLRKMILCDFDPTYGLSGRLVLFGHKTVDGNLTCISLFDLNDLKPLKSHLRRLKNGLAVFGHANEEGQESGQICKYREHEFDLWVSVFEYLFGKTVIGTILDDPMYNPPREYMQQVPGAGLVDEWVAVE